MERLLGSLARPTDVGSTVVAGLGVATALGYAWNFEREMTALEVTLPPLVVFLLGVALSGVLVYAGGRLAASAFTDGQRRSVAGWAVVGGVVWLGVTVLTVLIRLAEGRSVAEPQLVALVNFDAGAIAGTLVGALLVTVRRERDQAQQARDTLAFLNRTLRHEVLNGVQLLRGHAESLAGQTEGDTAETAQHIIETSEEVVETIRNVQAVADVQAGDAELEPVDLAAVAEDAVAFVRATHGEASLSVDADGPVRAAATDTVEHAVRNLVANAVEHSDRDAPAVTVRVRRTDGRVEVRVADDGPGFDDPAAALEPSAGSTHGFGLYLVKTLAEGYGGELTIADNEPRGAVVTLTLPTAD